MSSIGNGIPLLPLLVAFRLVDALSIKTFFQPDEYFQSLEPAWKLAFGLLSNAWETWEWKESLRSSVHPLLFAAIYKLTDYICTLIGAEAPLRARILIVAPKILQAIFAATADFYTYKLARKVWPGKNVMSQAALVLTAVNPWQWFCSVRTLSNSLEMTLTIVALYYWPWTAFLEPRTRAPSKRVSSSGVSQPPGSKSSTPLETSGFPLSLCLAALACILRPTNIIIWATISFTIVWEYSSLGKTIYLVSAASVYGTAILVATIAADRFFYGDLVFPPLRFLQFNVVRSLSVFYGQNRPDYYLTEGLPLLLTTTLPFACVGVWKAMCPKKLMPPSGSVVEVRTLYVMAIATVVSVLSFSVVSHKEVRFIFPLLPIMHILAAPPLVQFYYSKPGRIWRRGLLLLGLVLNVFIAFYVSYVHQRGVVDIIHYLRQEHELRLSGRGTEVDSRHAGPTSVGFLMPCHSTPWRSHLVHADIDAWALTCEPPLDLDGEARLTYLDEADVFYASPKAWIRENMSLVEKDGRFNAENADDMRREWPQYLVFFEQLEPTMKEVLHSTSYRECWRGFNTHWHDDWRRQGDVVAWCLHS